MTQNNPGSVHRSTLFFVEISMTQNNPGSVHRSTLFLMEISMEFSKLYPLEHKLFCNLTADQLAAQLFRLAFSLLDLQEFFFRLCTEFFFIHIKLFIAWQYRLGTYVCIYI